MSFFNETNRKRVSKIMETLELISKSGNANRADREDFQNLLEPLIQAMAELSPAVAYPQENREAAAGGVAAKPSASIQNSSNREVVSGDEAAPVAAPRTVPESRLHRTPLWVSVEEMAREAPLQELGHAVFILSTRIDEALYEMRN